MQKKKKKEEEEQQKLQAEKKPAIDDGDSIFDDVAPQTEDHLAKIIEDVKLVQREKPQKKTDDMSVDALGIVSAAAVKIAEEKAIKKEQTEETPAVGPAKPDFDALSAFMEDAYGVPSSSSSTSSSATSSSATSAPAAPPATTKPTPKPAKKPEQPLPASEYYFTDTAMSSKKEDDEEDVDDGSDDEHKKTKKEESGRSVNDVFRSLGTVLDSSAITAEKKRRMAQTQKASALIASVNSVPDEYSECYPAAFEGLTYAAEEGEERGGEEDLTKMDTKKKLKRWDFETDEEWEKYESKREAIPKAAFQFGVKAKEGKIRCLSLESFFPSSSPSPSPFFTKILLFTSLLLLSFSFSFPFSFCFSFSFFSFFN